MPQTIYHRKSGLFEAQMDDELVAFDAEQGDYFGLNQVAKMVWESLAEPKTFQELHDQLLTEYDVTDPECTSALKELLQSLSAEGLLSKTIA